MARAAHGVGVPVHVADVLVVVQPGWQTLAHDGSVPVQMPAAAE